MTFPPFNTGLCARCLSSSNRHHPVSSHPSHPPHPFCRLPPCSFGTLSPYMLPSCGVPSCSLVFFPVLCLWVAFLSTRPVPLPPSLRSLNGPGMWIWDLICCFLCPPLPGRVGGRQVASEVVEVGSRVCRGEWQGASDYPFKHSSLSRARCRMDCIKARRSI